MMVQLHVALCTPDDGVHRQLASEIVVASCTEDIDESMLAIADQCDAPQGLSRPAHVDDQWERLAWRRLLARPTAPTTAELEQHLN